MEIDRVIGESIRYVLQRVLTFSASVFKDRHPTHLLGNGVADETLRLGETPPIIPLLRFVRSGAIGPMCGDALTTMRAYRRHTLLRPCHKACGIATPPRGPAEVMSGLGDNKFLYATAQFVNI